MALTDSLVAYWTLNGVLTEEVNGYTLTNNNSTSLAGTGLVYANVADLSLSAVNYLTHADTPDLSGSNTDFTVAAWVNINGTTTAYDIIGQGEVTGFGFVLRYTHATDSFRFVAASAAAETDAALVNDGGGFPTLHPASGTWYLVVGYHDAANNVIGIASSVNSMTKYETAYTAGVWDATGDFNIGRGGPYFPSYMDGRIGPVMVWRRILLDAELVSLYNGGAGLTYAAMSSGPPPPGSTTDGRIIFRPTGFA